MLNKKELSPIKMQEILIYGAGGHAKVVIDTILQEGKYMIIGLIDDRELVPDLLGFPVFKSLDEISCRPEFFIVAIGDNAVRKQKFELLKEAGIKPATVIHPSAIISDYASIGEGSLICLKASVNTDARIGDNTIINSGANVEHECVIGSHVHISSGVNLAGRTRVEEGAFAGISSTTLPGINVGSWSTIAAGAVVIKDVEPSSKVAGVPAKLMRSKAIQPL